MSNRRLLRKIVQDLKAANFNTIFFQARARGDAYYRSRYEPWAENLTGIMGQDPGWDPLAFVIDEAHRYGMEVHAWINVYKVRSSMTFPLHHFIPRAPIPIGWFRMRASTGSTRVSRSSVHT